MATLTLFLRSLSPDSPEHATVALQRTSSSGLTGSFTQISFNPIERPEDDAASDFILVRSTLQNDVTKSTLDVVIKATLLRRCEYEIVLETKAYENYGTALTGLIPEFHGLFVEGPNAIVQCLVMQYCGEPLPTAFSLLPLDLRWKIVRQVSKMHEELGLHHLALFERNILRDAGTGNIYFIDLRMLRPHRCERKLRIKAGCIHPSPDEVDCDELYKLITKMQLWASNCVEFWGEPIFLRALGSAEDLMAMYPKYKFGSEERRKQMLVEAKVFLKNVVIPPESPLITECLTSEDVFFIDFLASSTPSKPNTFMKVEPDGSASVDAVVMASSQDETFLVPGIHTLPKLWLMTNLFTTPQCRRLDVPLMDPGVSLSVSTVISDGRVYLVGSHAQLHCERNDGLMRSSIVKK